jgi:phosphatidylglycerophosphate synthase
VTVTTPPVDVRSERFGDTLRRLSSAQKGAVGAPAYSRFVNRRLGRVLAAVAFHLRLTPNAVTAVSALFTFSGIAVLALVRPSWPTGVAVTLLLVIGYALDSADGQLARLRGGGSPAGEWLDHMVDALKLSGLHLAVLIGLYRSDVLSTAVLLVPVAYCIADSALFFAMMLNEALRAQHGAPTRAGAPTGARPGVWRALRSLPTDYGLLALVFVLWGSPVVFVSAYAVLFVATVVHLVLGSVKWFGEMGRLPR